MAIIQQSYPFTTAGNYTYPATIEVTGGLAQLALSNNAGQTFNQDFSASAGFTYDVNKTEFAAGQVQQIDAQPADSVSWATYTSSIDLNYGGGVLTGTANGGASVAGNKLDLNYGDSRFVSYSAASNISPQQTGCVKFKYTPNYSGTPIVTMVMFTMNESVASSNNELVVYHQKPTGELRFNQRDAAGITQASGGAVWNPVLGTEYEIELNYDLTTGNCRLFVDGVLHVADLVTTGTRGATINHFVVGTNWSELTVSNFSIADFVVFDTVQHTAPYATGYTLQEYKYLGDLITLPTFNYSGIGNIQSFDSLVSTEGNTPRYIVNNQYWNGSAWAASSDSWSTASPLADINANLASLTVGNSVTFKIVTNDSPTVQMSVDDLTLTYTGQIYNTGNPIIYPNSGVSTTEFDAFAATTNAGGSDAIRFALEIDGTDYWWDGERGQQVLDTLKQIQLQK